MRSSRGTNDNSDHDDEKSNTSSDGHRHFSRWELKKTRARARARKFERKSKRSKRSRKREDHWRNYQDDLVYEREPLSDEELTSAFGTFLDLLDHATRDPMSYFDSASEEEKQLGDLDKLKPGASKALEGKGAKGPVAKLRPGHPGHVPGVSWPSPNNFGCEKPKSQKAANPSSSSRIPVPLSHPSSPFKHDESAISLPRVPSTSSHLL